MKSILAFERPDLLKEWDFEKNLLICAPDEISVGSNKKVWWICPKGHSYQQIVEKKTKRNYGCPICSGTQIQ
ncbi:MAG: zinc-ribbon domain-containing protein [Solobacterium sp.]|nr:zinc-ribbon domain-containing protein [Solobacterium sp.]